MPDYERMDGSEVKRLAKQGNDKDALFEMAWRIELMPSSFDNQDPVYRCAWQDIWFEKATNAGHFDAKSRYARSLIDRIGDAEYRQKAMGYFESIANDFDDGRLIGDAEIDGILAKFWLGVLLCEGFGTRRDAIEGSKCIETALRKSNGLEKFGARFFMKLGEIYASGYAQVGEEPSIDDLELAIKFFEIAIEKFNPEQDNPRMLEFAKQQLAIQKERKANKENMRRSTGQEPSTQLSQSEIDERRRHMMTVSPEAQRRLDADKAAVMRLNQYLARGDW